MILFHTILLLAFIPQATTTIYNSSQYSLGPNLVSDPQFLRSTIPSGSNYYFIFQNNMSAWTCQNKCEIYLIPQICTTYGRGCSINYTRGLDLDSASYFDNISQSINIPAQSQYLFTLNWIPPYQNPLSKKFKLSINNTAIIDIAINTSVEAVITNQAIVNLTMGVKLLSLRMYSYTPDSSGAVVTSVSVQQLIAIDNTTTTTNTTTNATTNNTTANATTANTTTNATANTTTNATTTNTTDNTTANATTNNATNTNNTATNNSVPSQNDEKTFFIDVLDSIMVNKATEFINSMPGNRIFLNQLTEFLSIFDRLYLYYYHEGNCTEYASLFLQKIKQINTGKSILCQLFFQTCENSTSLCRKVNEFYAFLSQNLNQKYNYTSTDFLSKNANGIGFFANNLDFIYYQTPFSLLLGCLFFMLFDLLFNYKISVVFRKYSLLAIVFFVFLQGNIQQFAFYIFSQLKYFFSANFVHKMANVAIVFMLFLIIVFSVGGLLFLKFHYKKLIKYFVEYYGLSTAALFFESCERMIFPLLLGCVHAFYTQNILMRTITLTLLQAVYGCLRIAGLRWLKVQFKLKMVLSFLTSALRIIIILTLYWFQVTNLQMINLMHKDIFIAYMLVWIIEFVSNILLIVFGLFSKGKNYNQNKLNRQPLSAELSINSQQYNKMGKNQKKKFITVLRTPSNELIQIFSSSAKSRQGSPSKYSSEDNLQKFRSKSSPKKQKVAPQMNKDRLIVVSFPLNKKSRFNKKPTSLQ